MTKPRFTKRGRRVAAEAALLAGLGLVMAEIGPYATIQAQGPVRIAYWLICIVGGGVSASASMRS